MLIGLILIFFSKASIYRCYESYDNIVCYVPHEGLLSIIKAFACASGMQSILRNRMGSSSLYMIVWFDYFIYSIKLLVLSNDSSLRCLRKLN